MNRTLRITLASLVALLLALSLGIASEATAKVFLKEGKKSLSGKNYAEAIDLFNKAIKEHPACYEAKYLISKAYGKQGDTVLQIKTLQDLADTMAGVADLGKEDLALYKTVVRELKSLDKESGEVQDVLDDYIAKAIKLGREALRQKNLDVAEAIFAKVLFFEPDNSFAVSGMDEVDKMRALSGFQMFSGDQNDWLYLGDQSFWDMKPDLIKGSATRSVGAVHKTAAPRNFQLKFTMNIVEQGAGVKDVPCGYIVFNYDGAVTGVAPHDMVRILPNGLALATFDGKGSLATYVEKSLAVPFTMNQPIQVTLQLKGQTLIVVINNKEKHILQVRDDIKFTHVGFGADSAVVEFSNAVLTTIK